MSSFSKKYNKSYYPQLDVSVINNGIDINRFKKFPKNKKKINGVRLLTIGSLTERKGQKNIINALPLLRNKFGNVFYQMVGAPVLSNEYENLASSCGVQKLIKIHSVLPDDLMVDVIYDSNIFIMLSNNLISGDVEGFGIAILEANYFGLPAIGSKNCGIEDAICDRKTGRLINPNNPNELVEAIDDVLENYKNYSEEAKKWALSNDWSIRSKAYLEMISGIMIDKEKQVYEFFNETNNYLHKDFGIHCRKEILFDLLGQIKNKRILDIGCGNGMVSLKYGHSNYLTLADISNNMIKISKDNAIVEEVDNVKFLVSSLENLKNEKQYDIIIALGLLAHTNSLKSSIENLRKRLKKGGYLILQFSEFSFLDII